jgi:ferredoxin-NADP reductase
MATHRTARLRVGQDLQAGTRLLELELPDGLPLGFVGGQYLLMNTGIPLPDGKVAKRAYSLLSDDAVQDRFQIAVRRIGEGAASNFLGEAPVGTELPFSGPWGKFVADGKTTRALVLCTDTGITAALGLLRSAAFAPRLGVTELVWLVSGDSYFLPFSLVQALLPPGLGAFSRDPLPPVGHPERLGVARTTLAGALATSTPASAYLSGDGAVIYPLRDDLCAAGVAEVEVRLEPYFNNPQRRAP